MKSLGSRGNKLHASIETLGGGIPISDFGLQIPKSKFIEFFIFNESDIILKKKRLFLGALLLFEIKTPAEYWQLFQHLK